MKKLLVAIISLLALMMMAGAAQAARKTGGQVGIPIPRETITSRSGNSCTTDKSTYEAGEPIVFTVSYPEGGRYEITLAIDDHSYSNPNTADTLWESGPLTSSQTTYDMAWLPGEYWVFVHYFNSTSAETPVDQSVLHLTVTECSGTNTVKAMAQQVVANNRGANDYETFVNLYKWLMNNNTYDWDFHYYSAESVFLLHKGVCSSYARALELLLTTAGISSRRVSGSAGGGNHAWNVVRLGGAWVQCDATWDDPDSSADSYYFYCGLSDALMWLDHTQNYVRDGSVSCSTLNNHYWMRKGTWEFFGQFTDEDWTDHDIRQEIVDQVNNGSATVDLVYSAIPDGPWYPASAGSYTRLGLSYLLLYAKCLEHFGLSLDENVTLDVTADFSLSDKCLSVTVNGWKDAGSGELDLPDDLTIIEERAFEGTDAARVLIPESCLSIGDYAFLNSSVQCVTIPNPDTEIGTDAFGGCSPLMIIAPDNSEAAGYAEANGILRLRP